jgi:hypothetical protein
VDKQTLTVVIVALVALMGGALLCGLMCLSAYHAHCHSSMTMANMPIHF